MASISCGVAHAGMARRGGVQLLLEHALVDRRDGVLGAAKDLGAMRRACWKANSATARQVRREIFARAVGDLVHRPALAPLLGAVGVVDGHAHDRDRRVDAADRPNAGDAPPGAQDDLAVDGLAQDGVGAADVARALGRDGGGLQAVAVPADRLGGLEDHGVPRAPAILERQVVPLDADGQPDDGRVEDAERLLEESCPVWSPSVTTRVVGSIGASIDRPGGAPGGIVRPPAGPPP